MLAGGRVGKFLTGLRFNLSGFLLMLLFSWLYLEFGIYNHTFNAVFQGFQAAVMVLIYLSVHRIGKPALLQKTLVAIAILSSIAHFLKCLFTWCYLRPDLFMCW